MFYPELVRVVYTTTHIDGETGYLCAEVKGKQIVMTTEIWEDIVGLFSKGIVVNQKGLKDVGVKFNKVTKYKALIKNPYTFSVVMMG